MGAKPQQETVSGLWWSSRHVRDVLYRLWVGPTTLTATSTETSDFDGDARNRRRREKRNHTGFGPVLNHQVLYACATRAVTSPSARFAKFRHSAGNPARRHSRHSMPLSSSLLVEFDVRPDKVERHPSRFSSPHRFATVSISNRRDLPLDEIE